MKKFYELAEKKFDALNPKFRKKAFITRVQSEKIINVLQNKRSTEKVSNIFLDDANNRLRFVLSLVINFYAKSKLFFHTKRCTIQATACHRKFLFF